MGVQQRRRICHDLAYSVEISGNETFGGRIGDDDYLFSDSMDIMNVTLRTENEKYSGTRISIIDLSGGNTVMVVTFPDGTTKYASLSVNG